jgi:hypothetical protein
MRTCEVGPKTIEAGWERRKARVMKPPVSQAAPIAITQVKGLRYRKPWMMWKMVRSPKRVANRIAAGKETQ